MTNEELYDKLRNEILYLDKIAFIQSFREEIERETVEKCQDVIRDKANYYNNGKLPSRYEECIKLLDQLKQQPSYINHKG